MGEAEAPPAASSVIPTGAEPLGFARGRLRDALYRPRSMRRSPEDRIVAVVIGLLGLAVFAACVWLLWQSGCEFQDAHAVPSAHSASDKAMGIAGLIVASGIIFAGMSLVLRLRSSREDHPPSLSAPVLIICLGGAMALATRRTS